MENTNIVKFSTNYLQEDAMQIIHQNTFMDSKESIKFLGLKIDKYIYIGRIILKKYYQN
jgi:hypothetical protein